MSDYALDALLLDYAPPPPSADLAARAVAAALAMPQQPRKRDAAPVAPRPRHDRGRPWTRRPMLVGGIALGLAVSGAVAATLAGVRLDKLPLVEAILGESAPRAPTPPPQAPPPPRAALPGPALPPVEAAPVHEAPAAAPRIADPPAPHAAPPREPSPTAPAPLEAPRPPEPPMAQRLERPALPPPPLPAPPSAVPPAPTAPRNDGAAATSNVAEARRVAAPAAGEPLRVQRDAIERAERLRAVRQAQIERLQRVQQNRERLRRLRRD